MKNFSLRVLIVLCACSACSTLVVASHRQIGQAGLRLPSHPKPRAYDYNKYFDELLADVARRIRLKGDRLLLSEDYGQFEVTNGSNVLSYDFLQTDIQISGVAGLNRIADVIIEETTLNNYYFTVLVEFSGMEMTSTFKFRESNNTEKVSSGSLHSYLIDGGHNFTLHFSFNLTPPILYDTTASTNGFDISSTSLTWLTSPQEDLVEKLKKVLPSHTLAASRQEFFKQVIDFITAAYSYSTDYPEKP